MSSDPTLFGQERWTATELGAALCLSTQRINQLVKEGTLPAPIDGRYLPRDAMAAYVRHLKQREAGRSQAGEATTKMQLENQMRRIKLQRIAGELVPVDQVQKDWFACGRRVRDGLLNLPSRLSGVFAAESNQEKIFAFFTKEIHVVLTELSSRPPSKPANGDGPVEESSETERSPNETEAMGEAADHDVQAHTGLEYETDHREGRFPTGD